MSWGVLGYPGVSWGNQTDPFLSCSVTDVIVSKNKFTVICDTQLSVSRMKLRLRCKKITKIFVVSDEKQDNSNLADIRAAVGELFGDIGYQNLYCISVGHLSRDTVSHPKLSYSVLGFHPDSR